MGNYTILHMFENPRRGRQARNFTTNAPKILGLKSSSEKIFSRKLPLGAPEVWLNAVLVFHKIELKSLKTTTLCYPRTSCLFTSCLFTTHPPSPASQSGSRLPSIFNSVCHGLVPGEIDSQYLIIMS